ncbi:MAG: FCD domain-containing protein [Bacillota bacterium]
MDVFNSKSEVIKYRILDYLKESKAAIGSWSLQAMLSMEGERISTATIGRLLKTLDAEGLTEQDSGRGRVITPKGEEFICQISEKIVQARLHYNIIAASNPYVLKDLIDLVGARKALECEAARLAAKRATPYHLEMIRNALNNHYIVIEKGHDPSFAALDYHDAIITASQNKFIIATLGLLNYQNRRLEKRIAKLETRERGSQYVAEHELITKAIENRDAENAGKLMWTHMEAVYRCLQEEIEDKEGGARVK